MPEGGFDCIIEMGFKLYCFAIYSDITPKGENRLFKKLNQGTSLNAFQKAIINNISVRTQFSEKLLGHPGLEKLYSDGCFERDVVENHLISLLGFMLACDNNKSLNAISLEPKDLLKENNTSYILNVDNLSDDDAEKWRSRWSCFRCCTFNCRHIKTSTSNFKN